jgi:glycosyltransferase involved in cell wall biosynthesis
MKIACITTSCIPSSAANSIQAMKVCHALRVLNNEVRLWVPEYQTATWSELSQGYGISSPFEVYWLRTSRIFKLYDFCWKAVSNGIQWNADLIYTWSLQAAVFGLLRKKPVVMEFHDFPMGLLGPILFQLLLRISGKKVILTTTRALANGLEEKFNIKIPEQILQIAPNGTDLELYKNLPSPEEARHQLRIKEKFTIVYSGHFYSGRGMNMLIGLAQSLPQYQFLWVGGRNEDIEPWKQRLIEQGVRNVVVTGFINNAKLPLYQAAADVLVMPYQRAISGSSGGNIVRVINPMKMFDYLATGRPIIASDIPVFHEVLNENNAMFCPPEEVEDWVNTIIALEKDKPLRERLARQAQAYAPRYTWTSRARQTLKKVERA